MTMAAVHLRRSRWLGLALTLILLMVQSPCLVASMIAQTARKSDRPRRELRAGSGTTGEMNLFGMDTKGAPKASNQPKTSKGGKGASTKAPKTKKIPGAPSVNTPKAKASKQPKTSKMGKGASKVPPAHVSKKPTTKKIPIDNGPTGDTEPTYGGHIPTPTMDVPNIQPNAYPTSFPAPVAVPSTPTSRIGDIVGSIGAFTAAQVERQSTGTCQLNANGFYGNTTPGIIYPITFAYQVVVANSSVTADDILSYLDTNIAQYLLPYFFDCGLNVAPSARRLQQFSQKMVGLSRLQTDSYLSNQGCIGQGASVPCYMYSGAITCLLDNTFTQQAANSFVLPSVQYMLQTNVLVDTSLGVAGVEYVDTGFVTIAPVTPPPNTPPVIISPVAPIAPFPAPVPPPSAPAAPVASLAPAPPVLAPTASPFAAPTAPVLVPTVVPPTTPQPVAPTVVPPTTPQPVGSPVTPQPVGAPTTPQPALSPTAPQPVSPTTPQPAPVIVTIPPVPGPSPSGPLFPTIPPSSSRTGIQKVQWWGWLLVGVGGALIVLCLFVVFRGSGDGGGGGGARRGRASRVAAKNSSDTQREEAPDDYVPPGAGDPYVPPSGDAGGYEPPPAMDTSVFQVQPATSKALHPVGEDNEYGYEDDGYAEDGYAEDGYGEDDFDEDQDEYGEEGDEFDDEEGEEYDEEGEEYDDDDDDGEGSYEEGEEGEGSYEEESYYEEEEVGLESSNSRREGGGSQTGWGRPSGSY